MRIKDVTAALEAWAPRSLQEEYDNSGLLVGDPEAEVVSALIALDVTEAVVLEAVGSGCGLIISHHPIIFRGLKNLVPHGHVERTVLAAIKHGIALYAIHTNLDNVSDGVNGEMANRLGLKTLGVLDPRPGSLRKLVVFVPADHAEPVRTALYGAGAGHIGEYSECSFSVDGMGTFRPGPGSHPFVGQVGVRHQEREVRIEVIYRTPGEATVLSALKHAHPYEEVAYDIYPLANSARDTGSGLLAEWDRPVDEPEFLQRLKGIFRVPAIRHTRLLGKPIRRVALCGGSGAFLIRKAKAAGVDAFVTGDVKYHEFFEADDRLLLADIGHFGSEQFTMHLIQRRLGELFPTFAVRLTEIVTDPIYHY